MLVDIAWLETVQQRLREVNSVPLKDIEWVKDGKLVKFNKDDLINFNFMGLNNSDLPKYFECEEK